MSEPSDRESMRRVEDAVRPDEVILADDLGQSVGRSRSCQRARRVLFSPAEAKRSLMEADHDRRDVRNGIAAQGAKTRPITPRTVVNTRPPRLIVISQ